MDHPQVHRRGIALADGGVRVLRQTGPVFRLARYVLRGGLAAAWSSFFRGKTGKDARCSDAVFALRLAPQPDVFLNWSTPKGFPLHCRGSEEPWQSHPVRRPSVTRLGPLGYCPDHANSMNPCFPFNFPETFPNRSIPEEISRPASAFRSLAPCPVSLRSVAVRTGLRRPASRAREKWTGGDISCG